MTYERTALLARNCAPRWVNKHPLPTSVFGGKAQEKTNLFVSNFVSDWVSKHLLGNPCIW